MPPHLYAFLEAQDLCLPSLVRAVAFLLLLSERMAAFKNTPTFTTEQIATAPDLEPAFENLLRTLNVDESIINCSESQYDS